MKPVQLCKQAGKTGWPGLAEVVLVPLNFKEDLSFISQPRDLFVAVQRRVKLAATFTSRDLP